MLKRIILSRLTVRRRLIALAAASVLASVVVSAAGLIANEYSSRIMQRQDQIAAMIGNHKDIDTMHDSMRAYVLLTMRQIQQLVAAPASATAASDAAASATALASAEAGDGMDLAEIQDEFKGHRDDMLAALKGNRELAVTLDLPEAAQTLEQIAPMIEESATNAADIVLGSLDEVTAANEKASRFLAR